MEPTNLNNDKKKRKSPLDLSTMVYGKVPPQSKYMEEAVLGAIMLDVTAFDTAAEILKPEMFYVEAHQKVFKAMCSLSAKGRPMDILMVCEELKIAEDLEMVGGEYYVTKLTNSVVSAANIKDHSEVIMSKWIQRKTIQVCGELIAMAYEDSSNPFELFEEADRQLSEVAQSLHYGDMQGIDAVLVEAVQLIEGLRATPEEEKGMTGVPFGFKTLDRATRGAQNGDLVYIGARPSVGKTAFALNVVRSAADHFKLTQSGKSVAVWSLEMKPVRLVLRMIAAASQEWLTRIQTGKLTEAQMKNIYSRGIQMLAQLKIFFDGNPGLTLAKLRAKARKLKKKENLGLIVIDYLQLMSGEEKSGRNREQEIATISRGLKNLAQELNIPIIALSQLSRELEKTNRAPMLSDLRESGSIEQDADLVLFLYGPTDGDIAVDADLKGKIFVKIGKARDGILDTIKLDFLRDIQLFEEIDSLAGGWRQVPSTRDPTDSAKLYIQTGSKMRHEDEDPF